MVSTQPVFKRKTTKERYQVRFWSTPELYKEFIAECDRSNLQIGHVFCDFMRWFIDEKNKRIE